MATAFGGSKACCPGRPPARTDQAGASGSAPAATEEGDDDAPQPAGGISSVLADGSHVFTVVAIDVAGNTSLASVPRNVTVDTVAPTAPILFSPLIDSGNAADGITNVTEQLVAGTSQNGTTITVFDNDVPVTPWTSAGLIWSIPLRSGMAFTASRRGDGLENITGSGFANTLTGNQLANVLIGGVGADTLNEWAGNDTLIGGDEPDTFAFSANSGQDTINDFQIGQDAVQLDHSVFPQAANLAAAISQDNALFTIGAGNTITFAGVSQNDLQLHVSDFHIV